ncbi:hypothetical protein MDAP_002497 [Mitosporidium daphniae]
MHPLVSVSLIVVFVQGVFCGARFTTPLGSAKWFGNTVQSVCWTGFEGETPDTPVHLLIKACDGGVADLGEVDIASGYHSIYVPGDLKDGSYTFVLSQKDGKNPAFPVESGNFLIEQVGYAANPSAPVFVLEYPKKNKESNETVAVSGDTFEESQNGSLSVSKALMSLSALILSVVFCFEMWY